MSPQHLLSQPTPVASYWNTCNSLPQDFGRGIGKESGSAKKLLPRKQHWSIKNVSWKIHCPAFLLLQNKCVSKRETVAGVLLPSRDSRLWWTEWWSLRCSPPNPQSLWMVPFMDFTDVLKLMILRQGDYHGWFEWAQCNSKDPYKRDIGRVWIRGKGGCDDGNRDRSDALWRWGRGHKSRDTGDILVRVLQSSRTNYIQI